MKYQIIPTVFSKNKKEFDLRFNKLIKVSKNLQIDFMDGKFVKAKSISLAQIPNLKGKGNFEAHLMVKKPSNYIEKLKSKGFKKVIFHYNTDDNVKCIAKIRKNEMKCFLALNPKDEVKNVCYLFDLLNGILLMGHVPGKEHLSLLKDTFKKIKEIRKINKKINIQIDGGVNAENINSLASAGANMFNTGSFVSEVKNPKAHLKELKDNLKS